MLIQLRLIVRREVIDDPDSRTVWSLVPRIERQLENGISIVCAARKTLAIEYRVKCPVSRCRVEITLGVNLNGVAVIPDTAVVPIRGVIEDTGRLKRVFVISQEPAVVVGSNTVRYPKAINTLSPSIVSPVRCISRER